MDLVWKKGLEFDRKRGQPAVYSVRCLDVSTVDGSERAEREVSRPAFSYKS